jgi:TetR/AcrR family transcriptional regulator
MAGGRSQGELKNHFPRARYFAKRHSILKKNKNGIFFLILLTIWLNYMVKVRDSDTSQERILAAAKKVFLAKGLAGARMQDIADEAGINKALLHYYFRSKEKLFEMIFKEALNQFFPKIVGIIGSDAPLFEKIEFFCREYIDMLSQNAFLPLFVLNEVNKQPQRFREKFWKNRETVLVEFIAQVKLEIKKGTIKNLHPGHLFLNMISLCIFPFIAKPIWKMTSGMDEVQFREFIEERKKEVPQFIIDSIRK